MWTNVKKKNYKTWTKMSYNELKVLSYIELKVLRKLSENVLNLRGKCKHWVGTQEV